MVFVKAYCSVPKPKYEGWSGCLGALVEPTISVVYIQKIKRIASHSLESDGPVGWTTESRQSYTLRKGV